jgi:hypothetical protein
MSKNHKSANQESVSPSNLGTLFPTLLTLLTVISTHGSNKTPEASLKKNINPQRMFHFKNDRNHHAKNNASRSFRPR